MSKKDKEVGKRTNPVLWFLFAIVIPLIVAVTITIIVLIFVGVDVKGWIQETGSKIPIVSEFISTEEETTFKKDKEKADSKISEQQTEIESLNKEMTDLKATIESLELDVVKAENKLNNEINKLDNEASSQDDANNMLKDMASSFKKMNKKQAALIFSDLDKKTAIDMLQELPNDVRGGILEAMDPKIAADLTKRFISSE